MTAKIHTIPGVPTTPETVLNQARLNFSDLKSVVVSVVDKDNMQHTYWSNMTTTDLAFHLVNLQDRLVTAVITGD